MLKGRSLRNLIGQAQLCQVNSPELAMLLSENNRRAMSAGKPQYVFLTDASQAPAGYEDKATKIKDHESLTPVQRTNIQMNLDLIQTEKIRNQKGNEDDDLVTEFNLDDLMEG